MVKKGLILVIMGGISLLISGVMVAYNNYINNQAAKESKKVYEKLQNINKEEVIALATDEVKTVNIDGDNYIGTISIPLLNLQLPIIADWDYKKMKKSPCRYYGSIATDDLVICAHSYDNLFGRIKNLNHGDLLILTDINKKEYIYKVEVIEILAPTDVKKMVESEFDLTLYTCTIDGTNRVTVRLNRV